MKNIAIIGAGGFGREVKTIIDAINKVLPKYNFIGFFDDGIENGTIVNGYPILGGISDVNAVEDGIAIVIAVANPKTRKSIRDKIINDKIDFPNLIHPNVIISDDDVTMGKGIVIYPGCILTCNIDLKDFVLLNSMCTVGHDVILEQFASFMPSVNVSGDVTVGENVYVGTGVVIINGINIGKDTVIGAGSVVYKSLPENCTAMGMPAKAVKYND